MMICALLSIFILFPRVASIGEHDTPGADFIKEYPEILPIQADFGVGGKHGTVHPELWLKGAALIVPQLNQIIDFVSPGFVMETLSVEEGRRYYKVEENEQQVATLGQFFKRFKSDKANVYHQYHNVYASLIEQLGGPNQPLRYLEIGI
jgi:hypothetical protein